MSEREQAEQEKRSRLDSSFVGCTQSTPRRMRVCPLLHPVAKWLERHRRLLLGRSAMNTGCCFGGPFSVYTFFFFSLSLTAMCLTHELVCSLQHVADSLPWCCDIPSDISRGSPLFPSMLLFFFSIHIVTFRAV